MCSFTTWISPGPEFDLICVLSKKIKIICTGRSAVLAHAEKHFFPQKFSLRLFVLLYVGKGVRNKSLTYHLNNLLIFYPWNYPSDSNSKTLVHVFSPSPRQSMWWPWPGESETITWSCLGEATVFKHSNAAWTIFKFSENCIKGNRQTSSEPAAWGSYK